MSSKDLEQLLEELFLLDVEGLDLVERVSHFVAHGCVNEGNKAVFGFNLVVEDSFRDVDDLKDHFFSVFDLQCGVLQLDVLLGKGLALTF